MELRDRAGYVEVYKDREDPLYPNRQEGCSDISPTPSILK